MNPKMLYVAPLRDFSGYANAARDYLRALNMAGCNLVARPLHYDGGAFKFSAEEEKLFERDLQNVDIVIQHTTPNETERRQGVFNVNYFAWETDRVPDEWVAQLNTMDLVLVPCEENIRASRRSGVIVPIEKIPHTFDISKYASPGRPVEIPGGQDYFKILTICQWSKKKGVDALLKAYFSEFSPADKTVLILKVYFGPNDTDEHRQMSIQQVQKIKEAMRLKDYPRVFLIHSIMDDAMIARLYATADCYAMASRGEGWSITHFDAMGYGVPPIAVNWGGPTEFITSQAGWLTNYNMSPVIDMPHPHPYMYTSRDNWAEPHVDDLKAALRDAHSEWLGHQLSHQLSPSCATAWSARKDACKARAADFSYDKIGPLMRDVILHHYKRWKANGH
jgi:glycosyltransferase involved in cell wall biosynthesis